MERKIYRNTRNGNKYLEVVRYACGHYHVAQFMQWGEIRNYTGGRPEMAVQPAALSGRGRDRMRGGQK